MEIPIIILLAYVAFMVTIRKRSAPVVQTAITPASEEHKLVKTWVESDNFPCLPGWKWKCSCGGTGTATNAKEGTSLGSESNAIERFKEHAHNYRLANGNEWKDKHDAVVKEFESFKDQCYCKETHTHRPLERL